MSEGKTYRNFTAADIEKYHKGLLTPKEMHDLEKAALDDPLLADALEGYAAVPVNTNLDIAELDIRLKERVTGKVIQMHKPAKHFPTWLKAAAAVVLIGGTGLLVYNLAFTDNSKPEFSVVDNKKDELPPSSNSNYIMPGDSLAIDTLKITPGAGAFSKEKIPTITIGATDSVSYKTLNSGYAKETQNKLTLNISDSLLKNGNAVTLNFTTSTPAPERKQFTVGDDIALQQKSKKGETQRSDKKGNPVVAEAAKNDSKKLTDTVAFLENFAKDRDAGPLRANYFRGRVMDNNNNALPFANVLNTRDNVGTYADAQGYFTLLAPDSTLNVQVRSIGFSDNNYLMRSNTGNQIVLQEDRSMQGIVLNTRKADSTRSRMGSLKFEEPEPADGWTNYDTYLANNIKLSEEIKTRQVTGEVRLSFEVDKNGNPVKIKVEKSLCSKCDQEAVRLVQQGPKWKKGKGKKSSRVTVSVPFESQK